MNNVIHFRPPDSPRRAASGERGAEILFFTGVRYQRMGEEPRAPASQPPRAPGKASRRRSRRGGGGTEEPAIAKAR
jgi:hypothetical protein